MASVKVLGGVGTVDSKKVCTELSYNKGWPKTCCRPIKVFRDGVGYCGIHDPVSQAERQRRVAELEEALIKGKLQSG